MLRDLHDDLAELSEFCPTLANLLDFCNVFLRFLSLFSAGLFTTRCWDCRMSAIIDGRMSFFLCSKCQHRLQKSAEML